MNKLEVRVFVENWCDTCKKVMPDLANLEQTYKSSTDWKNMSVDTDGPSNNITAVPTVIFLKNGVELERMIGERPAVFYELAIKKYI